MWPFQSKPDEEKNMMVSVPAKPEHRDLMQEWLPTTWGERLTRAKDRGYFSQQDLKLASDFTSCSIGEARQLREEPPFKATRSQQLKADTALVDLGLKFYHAIRDQNIDKAIECHEIIRTLWPTPEVEAAEQIVKEKVSAS